VSLPVIGVSIERDPLTSTFAKTVRPSFFTVRWHREALRDPLTSTFVNVILRDLTLPFVRPNMQDRSIERAFLRAGHRDLFCLC
jgi:hypothetical protein